MKIKRWSGFSATNVNGAGRTNQWGYDALYRLTDENVSAIGNVGYGYDPVGNRTNRTSTISQLSTAASSFNTNDWLQTDAYDSNGNTLWSTNGTVQGPYFYDAANHLTNYNNHVYLGYDGDGTRVWETVGGTTTYYLVDDRNPSGYAQVLEEATASSGSATLSKVYNYGLSLISQRAPGSSTNYFIADGHGSTRMLTDNAGNFVNAFAYDAYGILIASNAAPQTVYLYCGQQLDASLGLYYNRARYLNFNTGRFQTMDTYSGNNEDPLSLHKYLYGTDDPVNNDDPSGNDYGDFDINISSILQPLANVLLASAATPGGMSLEQLGAFAPKFPVVVVTMPNGTQYLPETKVKDNAQVNTAGVPINTPIYIAVPQGINPQNVVNTFKSENWLNPSFIEHFDQFWSNPANDYKTKYGAIYDAFGNFEYGATGAEMGLPLSILQGEANHLSKKKHGIPNVPINVADINSGYNAISGGGKLGTKMMQLIPPSP
jgi:RHS repeat-associated protein